MTWCHRTDFWALLLPWEVTWWNAVSAEGTIIFFLRNLSLIENHRRIGLRQQRNAAVYQDLLAEMTDGDLQRLWEKYLAQLGKTLAQKETPAKRADSSITASAVAVMEVKLPKYETSTTVLPGMAWHRRGKQFAVVFFIWHHSVIMYCSKSMTWFDSASASIIWKRKSRNLNTVCVYSEVFLEQVVACRSCTPGWLTCVSSVNQRQYEMPGLFYIPLFDWPQVVRGTSGAQHVSGVSSWLF